MSRTEEAILAEFEQYIAGKIGKRAHNRANPRDVYISEPLRAALGPPTLAALRDAQGNRARAARALGVEPRAIRRRIHECTVDGEPLRDAVAREWPSKGGRTSVAVARVDYEGTGLERVRVYVLAAHGEAREGEHVNRVIPVGKVRDMVVCQQCKGARTT